MTFSSNLIATARRLLDTYGESISIQRVAEGAYDPTDGTVAAGTTINYSADGYPFNYSQDQIDQKSVRQTDLGLYLAKPTSVVPAVGDVATVNSVAYKVINVKPLRAQGSDVIYELQLRL